MLDLTPYFTLLRQGPQRLRSAAQCPNFRGGLFGGQLLAHGLSAVASETLLRPVHTLHTQFLSAGDAQLPIDYRVKCLRHGRSFSHYQVRARQKNRLIALMLVACHEPEPGFSHQERAPEQAPPSSTSTSWPPAFEINNWLLGHTDDTPLEFVYADGGRLDHSAPDTGPALCWLRIRTPLLPHQQLPALAFISDLGILASTLIPHPTHLFHHELSPASLNHTLWFHEPDFDLNQWHLLKIASPWTGHGRGLGQSYLFDQKGVLIATAAQEGLIRSIAAAAKPA